MDIKNVVFKQNYNLYNKIELVFTKKSLFFKPYMYTNKQCSLKLNYPPIICTKR